MAALDAALADWRALLGPGRARRDAASLSPYAASTAARPVPALAVLFPDTHEEVVACVRIAARHGVPLYPLSSGRNWGYGDACPARPGQVILDLSGMNRILAVDAELAVAVLEPGVTQGQLAAHLAQQRLPLAIDCTGAGPDTSLLGNILERGFGHSRYGNRFLHCAGLRVVLADGQTLETGFGHFPQARCRHLFPSGPGPWIDGLFTQSNLGIVTAIGLWLMPQPEAVSHLIASVAEHAQIAPVVDALRPLRLSGTLRGVAHIGNDLRVLSGGMVYPAGAAGPPLPPALRERLRRQAGVGAWSVSVGLTGRRDEVACQRRALRGALAGTGARLRFIDAATLQAGRRVARVLARFGAGRKLAARLALGQSLLNMNRGVPDGRFLAGAYWRRRQGLPPGFPLHANPATDGCGLIWLAPVLPMRGSDLLRVQALAQPLFDAEGFDLFATYSMINERVLGGVLTICFDQEDPDETRRAGRCHDAVLAALMADGYVPYRVAPQSLPALAAGAESYWQTVARIKAALDPQQIIAPGRYQPPAAPSP